jgi:sugar phosphate isomerase/epimerase
MSSRCLYADNGVKLALSTGWQPNATIKDPLFAARRHNVGIEVHRLSSEQELADLLLLVREYSIPLSSIHAVLDQYHCTPDNCAGDDISSADHRRRTTALEHLKRTIDFAETNKVPCVVVHVGKEHESSKALSTSKQQSVLGSSSPGPVRADTLDRLFASLEYLSRYQSATTLAIENQRLPSAVPTPDELALVLSATHPARVGFWYDIAHARAFARSTGVPREVWLKTAGSRLLGCHVQDSCSKGREHLPIGFGDDVIDRSTVPRAPRLVLEVSSDHTTESVEESLLQLKHLQNSGVE